MKMKKIAVIVFLLFVSLTMSAKSFIYNGIVYNVISESKKTAEVAIKPDAWLDAYQGDVVIPPYVSSDGVNYIVIGLDSYAFDKCIYITSISLPNTLIYIHDGAFLGCDKLKSITIPESVVEYGYDVFDVWLEDLTVLNPIPAEVSFNAFVSAQINNCVLHVPQGSLSSYQNSVEWGKFNQIIEIEKEPETINDHKYVDLGLPSGKLWAKTNYGASSEDEYGIYMNWPSRSNIWSDWGNEWSTPTYKDFEELFTDCSFSWDYSLNSVYGCRFTGPNGNSIFLPSAGFDIDGSVQNDGRDIFYWTDNERDENYAYALSGSTEKSISIHSTYNYYLFKFPIRPIALGEEIIEGINKIPVHGSYFSLNTSYDDCYYGKWHNFGDFDASAYDYLLIKFSGNTGKFRFGITYNEWKGIEPWGHSYYDTIDIISDVEGFSYIKLEKDKTYEFGIEKTENVFKGDTWDKHVQNVFTQDNGEPVQVNVEGVWFATQDALDTILWGGKNGKTVIDKIKLSSENLGDVFHNLQGQRVKNPEKGLYIQKGKKIIVR